eukprot:TRINITY_DN10557_c0_g2_i2.p1 TRINITY_DN10557_c0_g2~~TRINITY_DN10557_c0_g2_i2.p1  ORF type:complete len:401 (-),score=72.01 TRINITY_DN10557_c0_g2_i2:876-2078(-)
MVACISLLRELFFLFSDIKANSLIIKKTLEWITLSIRTNNASINFLYSYLLSNKDLHTFQAAYYYTFTLLKLSFQNLLHNPICSNTALDYLEAVFEVKKTFADKGELLWNVFGVLMMRLQREKVPVYKKIALYLSQVLPKAFYSFSQLANDKLTVIIKTINLSFLILEAFEIPLTSAANSHFSFTNEQKSQTLSSLQLSFFEEILALPKIGTVLTSLPEPLLSAKRLRLVIQAYYFELYLNPTKDPLKSSHQKVSSTFTIAGKDDFKFTLIFGNLLEIIFRLLLKHLKPSEVYSALYLAIKLVKRTQRPLLDLGTFSVDDIFERASIRMQINFLTTPNMLHSALSKLFLEPDIDDLNIQVGFLLAILISKILQHAFKYKTVKSESNGRLNTRYCLQSHLI